jgi:type III secretion system-like peptide-binding chaperone
MDFQNEAQESCYARVQELMTQLFGEEAWADPNSPSFVLRRGSADVHVSVAALEDKAVVAVFSWVATGVTPSEELYRYLLTENANFVFGGFALGADNTVIYQHTVVGDTIDKEQLRASVRAVAGVADDYDDQIAGRFGGTTAKAARQGPDV